MRLVSLCGSVPYPVNMQALRPEAEVKARKSILLGTRKYIVAPEKVLLALDCQPSRV